MAVVSRINIRKCDRWQAWWMAGVGGWRSLGDGAVWWMRRRGGPQLVGPPERDSYSAVYARPPNAAQCTPAGKREVEKVRLKECL